uniref:Growth hormone-regulated TBC protein 1 n=1 Tax=Nannospalax galili TaxID=1026970 RepID=A0A8C6QTU5_NANGA
MDSVERAQAARARVPRVDPYGFERPEDFDYAAYEEFFSTYLVILTKRAIKWSKLLKRSGGVRKSVTDLNRTFPDNVRFRKTAEPCLQKTLYNVLLAYGLHNRGVGYCQGMNFIAGYLILITKNEEESFWLLDALVGRILPDYYSPAMLGLKTDQEVLAELVRMKLPAVAALMDDHGVLWTLLVSRWFICLFVDILPVETVLRIWDCLFNEGSKIIFRVALTLIKQHQEFILEANSVPDICDKFKQITKGDFVTECHTFMQKIFSEPGSLSMTTITRLRESCRASLLAQG